MFLTFAAWFIITLARLRPLWQSSFFTWQGEGHVSNCSEINDQAKQHERPVSQGLLTRVSQKNKSLNFGVSLLPQLLVG